MIKRIKIENFRSFVKAEADLQPFTLVIGANGAGKSNLLRWFVFQASDKGLDETTAQAHVLHLGKETRWELEFDDGRLITNQGDGEKCDWALWRKLKGLVLFNLNPDAVSRSEAVIPFPYVKADGSGTVQVLDSLKNGDREDLFDEIEESFRCYVPEVEKLSLLSTGEGEKIIQVREHGLAGKSLPARELSEGTRLILCILTIIHQENPPPVILLEDIDRGMHPRLFERVAPLMRKIADKHDINIIATTHNPYLVDAFQDAKECVLLVEKVDGASVLVPLTERLKDMNYDEVESDMPLGQLWYSGMIGGVPLSAGK